MTMPTRAVPDWGNAEVSAIESISTLRLFDGFHSRPQLSDFAAKLVEIGPHGSVVADRRRPLKDAREMVRRPSQSFGDVGECPRAPLPGAVVALKLTDRRHAEAGTICKFLLRHLQFGQPVGDGVGNSLPVFTHGRLPDRH